MTEYIAYYRVSTERQGQSGLGLEAQREAVTRFIGKEPEAEFVDVISGRSRNRPELRRALARAKETGGTLVVAKLDRLARNTRFLLETIENDIDVLFCDLPDLPSGPTGKMIRTFMAAVAEWESGVISERTKAALAVAKQKGTSLGTAGPPTKKGGGSERARRNREKALEFARELSRKHPMLWTLPASEAARMLNDEGEPTPNGGKWHPTSVRRMVKRASL